MQLRHSGHSVYKTEYHITWIPKYRRRILNRGVAGYLSKLFPKILKQMPGVEIVEKNIQVDHIHLVMIIPPKYAIADVILKIKHYTAEKLRKKFAFLQKVYWKEQIVWSEGYFVSSVGDIDEKQIIAYVKWQQSHDSGQAKLELW
jgi:Transposase and inactivated derivatives